MNIILLLVLLLFIGIKLFGCWLEFLNYKHLLIHGSTVPDEFTGIISKEKLIQIKNYTIDKIKLGILNTVYDSAIIIIFLFCGILNSYNKMLLELKLPYYISGILFFLLIIISYTILEIPFDLYRVFKLEKKYSFSTMTVKLWISDFFKTLIVSGIIISILLFCILYTVSQMQQSWWLWCWILFFIFTLFMMYISPYVIEPLFNKFTSVENVDLINSLKNLMNKIGIKVSKVVKMDASKRTKHTNAYFSGIGHVKRIVLYDTTMEQMNNDEIISVIAHEAGHWKRKHILKNIITIEVISLIFFYAAYKLMSGNTMLDIFNISVVAGTIDLDYTALKFFLIYFLFGIAFFPVTPVMNYFTRKYEREADFFAIHLVKTSKGLSEALIKLSADNLSNLYPHPFYEAFNYSHPSILKRLEYLSETERKIRG